MKRHPGFPVDAISSSVTLYGVRSFTLSGIRSSSPIEAHISVYITSAPLRHSGSLLTAISAPVSAATALALASTDASTCSASSAGPYAANFMPILAHPYVQAYAMLFLMSPTKTTLTSESGLSMCSSMVMMSASIWVGWSSSVSPFHTGTPALAASSSTVACLKPLYSMPS